MCVLVKCVACFLCIKQYIITIRNEWDTLWLLKLCCMKEIDVLPVKQKSFLKVLFIINDIIYNVSGNSCLVSTGLHRASVQFIFIELKKGIEFIS